MNTNHTKTATGQDRKKFSPKKQSVFIRVHSRFQIPLFFVFFEKSLESSGNTMYFKRMKGFDMNIWSSAFFRFYFYAAFYFGKRAVAPVLIP